MSSVCEAEVSLRNVETDSDVADGKKPGEGKVCEELKD